MEYVTVVFTNGNVVHFTAQEFDADLVNTQGVSFVNKFPYKDAQGRDSFIHLKPDEVAGIFLTQPASDRDPPIQYRVARPK